MQAKWHIHERALQHTARDERNIGRRAPARACERQGSKRRAFCYVRMMGSVRGSGGGWGTRGVRGQLFHYRGVEEREQRGAACLTRQEP